MSESVPQQTAPSDVTPSEAAPVEESNDVVEEVESSEPTAEEVKKEVQNLKKKYQLKVNNKVKDVELDLGNDEEIQKYLSKALGAEEKFQEAANMRKQMEQLIGELKNNPLAILKHPELGIDVRKLAEMVLTEEIEEMQLTPEQKKIRDLENALKEREEKEKAALEAKEKAERERLENEAMVQLDEQISQALSKSTLPQSPYVVRRLTDYMIQAMDAGFKDVTFEQILPYVEEQITGELNRLFESAPDDTFDKLMESVVGKKNLDKYRKKQVSKVKVQPKPVIRDTGASNKKTEEEKPEPKRFKDIFGNF